MSTPSSGASPDGSRPLRRDAARNRERLIQSAREVFAARGFEASMDDIAHHAGLGVGTAYRHFANKFDLANAIFDTAVNAFVDSAQEAMTTPDPWQGLVDVIESTLEAQTGNRAIREILLGRRRDERERHGSILDTLRPLFERARDAGALRPDVELSDIAMGVLMLCAVADASVETSPYLWRRYLPALLAGLRPGSPDSPVPALADADLEAALAERAR